MIYLLLLAFMTSVTFAAALVLSWRLKPVSPLARQMRFQDQVWIQAYGREATKGPAATVVSKARHLLARLAAHRGLGEVVEGRLTKAGLQLAPEKAILYNLLISLAGYFVGAYSTGSVAIGILGLMTGAVLPVAVVGAMSGRRAAKLERQLPEALTIIAGSLKAGYSLPQAMEMVSQEMKPPVADDFRQVISETRLGMSLDDGLSRLAERTSSSALSWMIMAIRIQHEVGGNLAEVFEVLAVTMHEREGVRRQVKVLTAEGRLSAIILMVMPFLLALSLWAINPDYISLLVTTNMGWAMVGGAVFLMLVGALWLNKIVQIEV